MNRNKPGLCLALCLVLGLALPTLDPPAAHAAPSAAEPGDGKPADAQSGLRLSPTLGDPGSPSAAAPDAEQSSRNPGPRKSRKKSAARAKPRAVVAAPAVPDEAKVRELQALSGADIEKRIADQREILRLNPKDEGARQTLGLIAIELGNRILDLDALGRKQEIVQDMDVIRNKLHDTLWRVSQFAKSDGRAAAALGLFYTQGTLTSRDSAKACDLYARAALRGHVAAAFQSALCRMRSDPELARSLLMRAAKQDHAGAQELMGRACIEGEKKDSACAIEWLERASANGRASAMSLLGWVYASDPQRHDLGKAVSLYKAAAEAGDPAAQNNLGELFELGKGVPRDARLAFGWYLRAAEAGLPQAQLNLARLYAGGAGVEKNRDLARKWAERAQQRGQERAAELLDWLASQP